MELDAGLKLGVAKRLSAVPNQLAHGIVSALAADSMLKLVVLLLVGLSLCIGIATYAALELGGVVTIETLDQLNSKVRLTRIWFVKEDGQLILEAGSPHNPWVQDIETQSTIKLVGEDLDGEYLLTIDRSSAGHQKIRSLMEAKYGWRDAWIAMIFDTSDSMMVVPSLIQKPDIQAVIFDADGVVQHNTEGWIDRVRKLSGKTSKSDDFLTDLSNAERSCILGEAEFENELALVLRKWNSNVDASEAIQLWTEIEPSADVRALISAVRERGVKVALATNQQQYRANYMLDELGYSEEFDHVFCSCALGFAKPSRDYFAETIKRIGLEADQILFIDDSELNVQAAKLEGMQAVQFDLNHGGGPLEAILKHYLPEASI